MIPLTLPPIPLSPCLIAPIVLSAAPCLLLCAWQSQLHCHCKGHIMAPALSMPCPTPLSKRQSFMCWGHHPDFRGYQARTTMGRKGSSPVCKTLTHAVTVSQDRDGLGDKQVTQSIYIPLRGPAPAALPDHLQVLQAC